MIYKGKWEPYMNYIKGDIIYVDNLLSTDVSYYICSIEHESNDLTYPSYEDIYWVHIHNDFFVLIHTNWYNKRSNTDTTNYTKCLMPNCDEIAEYG